MNENTGVWRYTGGQCTPGCPAAFFNEIITTLGLSADRGRAYHIVEVTGDSMINAGIEHKDKIVVDAAAEPRNGNIIIIQLEDRTFLKRLRLYDGRVYLVSENDSYHAMDITYYKGARILGVVKKLIKDV